jgi:2-C-methyl-D-erythritol 4-phosphate cytidylyltransferase/2-C-methyl-D-erythritol 2,4-cyclodiphosphate synthase
MSHLPRSGFGYDVHRYGGVRPLVLGGLPINCGICVDAHSDGDVLLHALIDALLGCICAGDIGELFPDTDPALENIASGVLLAEVLERCRAAGFTPMHADLTIIAEVPRISPHRRAITANLAKLLRLDPSCVNVKAGSEERLGFTGEKKGIKAYALVSGFLRVAGKDADHDAD